MVLFLVVVKFILMLVVVSFIYLIIYIVDLDEFGVRKILVINGEAVISKNIVSIINFFILNLIFFFLFILF